jgi:hypothetical protein
MHRYRSSAEEGCFRGFEHNMPTCDYDISTNQLEGQAIECTNAAVGRPEHAIRRTTPRSWQSLSTNHHI